MGYYHVLWQTESVKPVQLLARLDRLIRNTEHVEGQGVSVRMLSRLPLVGIESRTIIDCCADLPLSHSIAGGLDVGLLPTIVAPGDVPHPLKGLGTAVVLGKKYHSTRTSAGRDDQLGSPEGDSGVSFLHGAIWEEVPILAYFLHESHVSRALLRGKNDL